VRSRCPAQKQTMKPTMLSKVARIWPTAERWVSSSRTKGSASGVCPLRRCAGSPGAFDHPTGPGLACRPKAAARLYWARRLEIVRTFAKHLLLTEPEPRSRHATCWVRPIVVDPHTSRAPHKSKHLLRRAGQLRGRLRPYTWQTLIGLLACTGLRISEAMRLELDDVDWNQSLLIIRESKYGKTRLVPLHPTGLWP